MKLTADQEAWLADPKITGAVIRGTLTLLTGKTRGRLSTRKHEVARFRREHEKLSPVSAPEPACQ